MPKSMITIIAIILIIAGIGLLIWKFSAGKVAHKQAFEIKTITLDSGADAVQFEYPVFPGVGVTAFQTSRIGGMQLNYLETGKTYLKGLPSVTVSSLQFMGAIPEDSPDADSLITNVYGFTFVPWKKYVEYEQKGIHYDVSIQGTKGTLFNIRVPDLQFPGFDRQAVYETIVNSFRYVDVTTQTNSYATVIPFKKDIPLEFPDFIITYQGIKELENRPSNISPMYHSFLVTSQIGGDQNLSISGETGKLSGTTFFVSKPNGSSTLDFGSSYVLEFGSFVNSGEKLKDNELRITKVESVGLPE